MNENVEDGIKSKRLRKHNKEVLKLIAGLQGSGLVFLVRNKAA